MHDIYYDDWNIIWTTDILAKIDPTIFTTKKDDVFLSILDTLLPKYSMWSMSLT